MSRHRKELAVFALGVRTRGRSESLKLCDANHENGRQTKQCLIQEGRK
jgi:hypothetical protein